MLTCYDYSMAVLLDEAGVPLVLVGDSASSVVLGYPNTLPVSLGFMIEITAAVRRGAPHAFLVADMPFGSYHTGFDRGMANVIRMAKKTLCDCVKLEISNRELELIEALTDAGVAVMPHLGLRPQSVGVMGGYKVQGRTLQEQEELIDLAVMCEDAGAVALLLEGVVPAASERVVNAVEIPVIGCGAGPACHGHVVVLNDLLKLTPRQPKFVPDVGDARQAIIHSLRQYFEIVTEGKYPGPEHTY